jgi:V8-like Glu-specific endopeptidase
MTFTRTKSLCLAAVGILGGSFLIGASQVHAQTAMLSTQSAEAVRAYWTPQRMRDAKPVELPISREPLGDMTATAAETGPPQGAPGGSPVGKVDASMAVKFYTPNADEDDGVAPLQTSSFGAHFTTHRVFPTAAAQTYPALTAGKLFFTKPGVGNFVCSAEVGRQRLLFTAGHCVYGADMNPKRFFTNFLFVPGLANGVGPTGSWTWRAAQIALSWRNGNGGVPNAQDLAIIEVNDRVFNGVVRKISFFTGFNGWRTSTFGVNHVTMLGYPCNIDSCNLMQRTDAGIHSSGGNNTFRFGSAARGGQSGGPILENFGVAGVGHPAPGGFGFNVSLSNASYGPTATEPKYIGASHRNQEFINILNQMCALKAGNCS